MRVKHHSSLFLLLAALTSTVGAVEREAASDLRQPAPVAPAAAEIRAPATNNPPAPTAIPATNPPLAEVIARLKNEGTNRSQIADIYGYLTDVIGPRLTGSPNCKRANEWTRDKLASWGLTNAHLEAWGPFGRGWSLKRFSAQVIEPQAIPLIAWPKAWSYGSDWPIVGEVVYLDARTDADYDKFKDKLKGCIVLISAPREVPIHLEPIGSRIDDTNLLRLANASPASSARPSRRNSDFRREGITNRYAGSMGTNAITPGGTNAITPGSTNAIIPVSTNAIIPVSTNAITPVSTNAITPVSTNAIIPVSTNAITPVSTNAITPVITNAITPVVTNAITPVSTNAITPVSTNAITPVSTNAAPRPRRGPRSSDASGRLRFAVREGAAATVSVSDSGDGGPVSVGEATVVMPDEGGTNRVAESVHARATNAPSGPPQIVLAAEHYNRLVHLIQAGEKVRLALEVQTQFHDDLMAYNTVAEIPGTDRKNEIVMLGAHLDSAPGGTGAADNGAGVAVCLEAVRLLQALQLKPRRTIRIGLWSGEEQGLLGSGDYVARHFGYFTNRVVATALSSSKDASQPTSGAGTNETRRVLVRQREYDRFSAYYNLDNGAGRIRGIHLQGNEPLRAVFRPWLEPLRELGAETITASNTGGTDHLTFDAIGLPGLQFIQDPLEYGRTYHTTMDVRERAPVADLQQAAIVLAAFVYDTAMADTKLPRKPLPENPPSRRR